MKCAPADLEYVLALPIVPLQGHRLGPPDHLGHVGGAQPLVLRQVKAAAHERLQRPLEVVVCVGHDHLHGRGVRCDKWHMPLAALGAYVAYATCCTWRICGICYFLLSPRTDSARPSPLQ